MTVYQIANRLKKDLLKADFQSVKENIWLEENDLMKLNSAIMKHLDSEFSRDEVDVFITCFDFSDYYNHYFSGTTCNEEYDYAVSRITKDFNSVLKFFYNQDYEVILREVELSEKLMSSDEIIIEKFEDLERALRENKLAAINTLSLTILDTLFKKIITSRGETYPTVAKFNVISQKALKLINIDGKESYDPLINDFIRNIRKILQSINEIRNIYSDSHGTEKHNVFNNETIPLHHKKMIVDITKTLANFFYDSYYSQFVEEDAPF